MNDVFEKKLENNELTLEEFWIAHAEWSQQVFGLDSDRGPVGPLKHLVKEIITEILHFDPEIEEAILALLKLGKLNMPFMAELEEYGDLQFLLFDATRRAGFKYEELRKQVNEKLKKNRLRDWQKPVKSDEPIEHVRGKHD